MPALTLSDVLGALGTLIGLIATVWQTRKAQQLQREKQSIGLQELPVGAQVLVKRMRSEGFKPDFILTPDYRGAAIASLITQALESDTRAIPVIVGYAWPKDRSPTTVELPEQDYVVVENNRWNFAIPLVVRAFNGKHCLIVDDISQSGKALQQMHRQLLALGFDRAKVKTAALVVSETCIKTQDNPSYHWRTTDTTDFRFPWGAMQ